GPVQYALRPRLEEPSDVRNCVQDECAVRAVNAVELNVRIVYPEIAAFADQMLEQRNHRTFAEVIGILLEREANDSDTVDVEVEHGLNGSAQMRFVAGQGRFEQGKLQIKARGAIIQGAQILGQAGAAECESGLQICRRNIE